MAVLASVALLFLLSISLSAGHGAPRASLVHVENIVSEPDMSLSLAVSPKVLQTSLEWVTVSWENVSNPDKGDWIGIYSPPTADVSSIAPVKYQLASSSPSHGTSGSGTLRFNLVNMRSNYSFAFFRNGTDYPVLAAISQDTVSFINPNEPLGGHIALYGPECPNCMRVSWTSSHAALGKVKWGKVGSDPSEARYNKAVGTTYKREDMCGAPANSTGFRDPGMFQTAGLSPLEPDTEYYYSFGNTFYGMSKTYTFRTPPIPRPDRVTSFIAYGDMGVGPLDGGLSVGHTTEPSSLLTTAVTMEHLNEIDFVLHFGDISYARGYLAEWDAFMGQIEPVATRVPYMTGEGNHERDYPRSGDRYTNATDSGGECGIPYYQRFIMPGSSVFANTVSWYSFNYGNVHVIVMSTEMEFMPNSPQYLWLENDLQTVNRSATPWVVLSGHRPMYVDCVNSTDQAGVQTVAEELRTWIEPMFVKYRVNLAMWGHHHSYQVTCPVKAGECVEEGEVSHDWFCCYFSLSCRCLISCLLLLFVPFSLSAPLAFSLATLSFPTCRPLCPNLHPLTNTPTNHQPLATVCPCSCRRRNRWPSPEP